MARLSQGEAIAMCHLAFRPRQDAQGQVEIGGGTSKRAADTKIGGSCGARQALTASRHQRISWLVAEHTAKMGGNADRSPDIGAKLQRDISGRERCGTTARRTARRIVRVPRIASQTVDFIEALPIRKRHRYVGLTDDDRPCPFEP